MRKSTLAYWYVRVGTGSCGPCTVSLLAGARDFGILFLMLNVTVVLRAFYFDNYDKTWIMVRFKTISLSCETA